MLCIMLNIKDVREGGGAVRKEWGRGGKNAVKLPSVRRGRILRRFFYVKKVSCLPFAGRWLILFYHVGCGVSVLRQLSCVRCGGRGLYVCMNERGGFLMEAAPFAVRLCCQSFFMRAVAWYATSSDYSTMLMPRLLNVVLSMPMYVRIC